MVPFVLPVAMPWLAEAVRTSPSAMVGIMDRACAEDLLEVLAARRGVICAVGAGGKKSTLYRLAEAHSALGSARVGLTATVMIAPPPASLFGLPLIAPDDELSRQLPQLASQRRLVAYARISTKPGRLGGVAPELVAELHRRCGFTATLVKADGARMRLIKAPAEDEPVLPPGSATVLPIVSAHALGRPLNPAIAHRLDRVAAITGAVPGEPLAPIHIARLMVSDAGALQNTRHAVVVPIINMVDDAGARDAACAAAREALAMTRRFDRVVLAAMTAADPLIEVVAAKAI
jgi:probable selenium-dependent hydroxylase accessory protein YqeC